MEAREPLPDEQLADKMAGFFADPLGHVMFSYPWDTEESIKRVKLPEKYRKRFNCEYGPDLWACEFLDRLGAEIRKRGFDGREPVDPIRFATVSGHEIGKSTLVAWLIKFILDTRPLSKGSVTAVTDEQLRTKTWAELGKWHSMSATEHWFTYSSSRGAMSLAHVDPKYAGQWRCDARTSREEKSESFAGQHAPAATSFYIFDEASGVSDKIFEVREGGLTSGEPMVFDFGNGTKNSGMFYENCAGKMARRYIVNSIDSRNVAITNKKKIAEDIEIWGIESDFVLSRWLGKFPKIGSLQFIPSDLVEEAGRREVPGVNTAPLVFGVDVARFGDDATVIAFRRGVDARSFPPIMLRGQDTKQVSNKIAEQFLYFEGLGQRPAMIFVDDGSMGGGVVDNLRHAGFPVCAVRFGSKPNDSANYRYKADEIWGKMRDAIRDGLCIVPRNSEAGELLYADLTQRQFGFTMGAKMHLETKADMKKRGLPSPDHADALAVTYAEEIIAGAVSGIPRAQPDWDYNPHEALNGAS